MKLIKTTFKKLKSSKKVDYNQKWTQKIENKLI